MVRPVKSKRPTKKHGLGQNCLWWYQPKPETPTKI
jgi:hypothetical protein